MEALRWDPPVFARLQELLAGPPGLAAFDFDNTLIQNDLGEAVMYYILFQGLLRADAPDFWELIGEDDCLSSETVAELRGLWNAVEASDGEDQGVYLLLVDRLLGAYEGIAERRGLEAAYRWSRTLFSWLPVQELRSIAEYVFESEQKIEPGFAKLPSGRRIPQGIRVYPEVEALIRELRARDWDVFVVTATPEDIIRAVIARWELPEERVLGMRLTTAPASPDLNPAAFETGAQIIQPIIQEPMTAGAGKVEALRLRSEHAEAPRLALGDSFGDLELLLEAENAVLLDRGSDELRERLLAAGALVQSPFAKK